MTTSYLKSVKASVSSRVHAKATAPKVKPTIVQDEPVTQAEAEQSIFEALNLPSDKRSVIAFVAGLIAGASTLYSGLSVVAYLAVGAAVLTGSAFLVFLISFVGYAVMLLASIIACGKLQSFILSGDIDRCYQKYSDTAINWFGIAKNKLNWSAA